MKLDRYGIRFRVFLTCFLFAVGIVLFLGLLQFSLIRPYYRENKINAVQQASNEIQNYIIDVVPGESQAARAFQVIVDNNVCVVMYNSRGVLVYDADSLGSSCVFHSSAKNIEDTPFSLLNGEEMVSYMNEEGDEISLNVHHLRTNQEMIVYGKRISAPLENYYLFVNSPLEPVDSIINFFARQYAFFTMISILLAIFISYILSSGITKPIVAMKREADKLGDADYSVTFDGGQFTETKELASTLNSAKDQLSKIDELRKDLIANVSHDIKTPLTSIRAYAEMIKDISGNDPDKREEHLDIIIGEADYLDHLASDMSELSKMQSGNYVLNQTNVNLSELIKEIILRYDPLFTENKIDVEFEIEDRLIIYADEVKISQVISNYVSNAIKHTPENKKITIRAFHKEEDVVRVEVQDEGEGIPESDLSLIWDRYQKSSQSFSRDASSTGLGLSIVKAILDTHHARYGVDSTMNEGSTFWFEFDQPVVEEE